MFLRWRATLRSASTGYWKGTGFMPLTRGKAVGYDADLMVFEFTMRNGEQVVQCQTSNAALGNLAGHWRVGERDVPAEFKAHRKLIEAIASAQFDSSREETSLVRIFAKQISTAQRGLMRHLPPMRLGSKKG